MRLKSIAAYLIAAGLSVGGATLAVDWVERRTAQAVVSTLIDGRHEWVDVTSDGLLVALGGQAPDEATRFRIVSAVGSVIDPDRIVDNMDVKPRGRIEPPRFSIEILRNGDGISLIGLVPTATESDAEEDEENFANRISLILPDIAVTNMLEQVRYPVPDNWVESLDYALEALEDLDRTKISVSPERVEITAISDSPEDKRRIEARLARRAPDSIRLALNISAPRPVITPFTLRYTLSADGVGSFDACSADDDATRRRILTAASEAGLQDRADCAIGLGVPSPNWAEAVEVALAGLKDLGGGALTFSDADVSIVALDTTAQGLFDRVVGEINAALPDVFSMHAVLPEKVVVDGTGESEAAIEFVATRSPEGLVQLRGRLTDDGIKTIVGSFARAQFGSDKVYVATRNDENLPENWPVRVLAALESLGKLENGSALVQPEYVEIRGMTGDKTASDKISQLLADKLGDGSNFEVAVRYDELLDPTLNIPTPEECVSRINAILAANKIVFEPSSAEITEAAGRTVDQIAVIAKQCDRVQMEIGGHTDSQGRESMNLDLSQQRADAVLASLLARRVLTRNLSSKGYGETNPIADNKTEAGREANRRIEFRLITDARLAPADGETASETSDETEETDTAQSEETAAEPETQASGQVLETVGDGDVMVPLEEDETDQ